MWQVLLNNSRYPDILSFIEFLQVNIIILLSFPCCRTTDVGLFIDGKTSKSYQQRYEDGIHSETKFKTNCCIDQWSSLLDFFCSLPSDLSTYDHTSSCTRVPYLRELVSNIF